MKGGRGGEEREGEGRENDGRGGKMEGPTYKGREVKGGEGKGEVPLGYYGSSGSRDARIDTERSISSTSKEIASVDIV